MSTRSVIARKLEDADNAYGCTWQGRYHHSDGYPSGLGAFLQKALHEQFFDNLKFMLYMLLDTKTAECGWSFILDADFSLEAISPEEHSTWFRSICKHQETLKDYDTWKDTPDGHIAEHSPIAYSKRTPGYGEEPTWFTSEDTDNNSWIEWVYVFDVLTNTVTVFDGIRKVGIFDLKDKIEWENM